jgi:hypothetical protein
MPRSSLLYVLLVVLTAPNLLAQSVANKPATRADILRLFEVMHTEEQVQQVIARAIQPMQAAQRELFKKQRSGITEDELDRMQREVLEVIKRFPVNDLIEDMIPVYQQHLSEQDVSALIGFYSTPTGQRLLRELPIVGTKAVEAAFPRFQQHFELTWQRVGRRIEEEEKHKYLLAPQL